MSRAWRLRNKLHFVALAFSPSGVAVVPYIGKMWNIEEKKTFMWAQYCDLPRSVVQKGLENYGCDILEQESFCTIFLFKSKRTVIGHY